MLSHLADGPRALVPEAGEPTVEHDGDGVPYTANQHSQASSPRHHGDAGKASANVSDAHTKGQPEKGKHIAELSAKEEAKSDL